MNDCGGLNLIANKEGDMTHQKRSRCRGTAAAFLLSLSIAFLAPGLRAANFVTPLSYPLQGVIAVATGDFNGDGKVDVAAKTYRREPNIFGDTTRTYRVYVLFGQGDGGLAQPALIWSTTTVNLDWGDPILGCEDPIAADFNRDGKTDLLVRTADGVGTMFLGSASGAFSASPSDIWLGCIGFVSDFNRDGILDLTSGGVVYLGNGDGTFQTGLGVPLPNDNSVVAVGDFDGDGNLDVVVSDDDEGVGLLRGRGDGTFFPATDQYFFVTLTQYGVGARSSGIGDFNGDGKLDLVTHKSSLGHYMGRGDGRFGTFIGHGDDEFSNESFSLSKGTTVADLNVDGKSDFLFIDGTGDVVLGWGATDPRQSNAEFFESQVASVPCCYDARNMAIADLNGDGSPDVIIAAKGNGGVGDTIHVYLSTIPVGSAYARDYVQKAYVGYYGRSADPGGQRYWARRMDAEGGSLNAIIEAFGYSDEFNRRYGGLSYADLVTKIYQQALGRDPDQGGLDWYVAELAAGRRTLQTITLDVLNGATTAPDSTVVANKLAVAAYYTAKVVVGCTYGTEQDGVNIISGVTAAAATVASAKAGIDGRCGQ